MISKNLEIILSYAHVPEIPSPLTWRKSHTLAMASEITGSVSILTTCLNCFLSCPQDSMQLDYYFVPTPVAVPGYLPETVTHCISGTLLLRFSISTPMSGLCWPRDISASTPPLCPWSPPVSAALELSARPDVTRLSHFLTAHPHFLRTEISRGPWHFSVLDGFTSMN